MTTYLIQRLFQHLARIFKIFKEEGGRAGLARLGRVIKQVFYVQSGYIILAYTLSDQVPLPTPKPGLVVRQVTTSEEIARLGVVVKRSSRRPGYINWLRKIFNNGSIGFIAWQNDQPVGWCWTSPKAKPNITVTHVQVPLRPGDIYVHTLVVSPTHRRQGIGQALLSYHLRFVREHGYKRVITVVRKDNISSLSLFKKIGYIHIGEMTHARILFWDSYKYNMLDA